LLAWWCLSPPFFPASFCSRVRVPLPIRAFLRRSGTSFAMVISCEIFKPLPLCGEVISSFSFMYLIVNAAGRFSLDLDIFPGRRDRVAFFGARPRASPPTPALSFSPRPPPHLEPPPFPESLSPSFFGDFRVGTELSWADFLLVLWRSFLLCPFFFLFHLPPMRFLESAFSIFFVKPPSEEIFVGFFLSPLFHTRLPPPFGASPPLPILVALPSFDFHPVCTDFSFEIVCLFFLPVGSPLPRFTATNFQHLLLKTVGLQAVPFYPLRFLCCALAVSRRWLQERPP